MAVVNPGQGRLRVWRGLALAAACLGIPSTAHIAAGGGVPAQGPFLFCAALLAVACIGLADRRRTTSAIAGIIGCTQPLLHGALALSSHSSATIVPHPRMILAHAAAACLLTLLLAGGEAVLWSMAALAGTVLGSARAAGLLVTWAPDVRQAVPVPRKSADLPRPRHLALACESPRRGPPVAAGI